MHHLVIGGTGFIGGHLVEQLVDGGGKVVVLARRPERPAWLPAAVELRSADLHDPASLAEHVEGVDLVYVTAPLPPTQPDERRAAVVVEQALQGLVAACRQARVGRLIFLSSVDLYPPSRTGRPISEDYPARPATPTGRLRLVAEQSLQAAAQAHRLSYVILRPVTVFGPRDHVFTRPLVDAYAAPPGPSLVDGGRARLSLVYVKDVARTLALAARHRAVSETVFHVGGFATTWRAFIAALCAELNVEPPRPGLPYPLAYLLAWWSERRGQVCRTPLGGREAVAMVGRTQLYTDARLVRALAYYPAYDLLAGVHEVIAWYRGLGRSAPSAPLLPPRVIPLPQAR